MRSTYNPTIHVVINTTIPQGLIPRGMQHAQAITQDAHIGGIDSNFSGLIINDRREERLEALLRHEGREYVEAIHSYVAEDEDLRQRFKYATIGEYNMGIPRMGTVEEIMRDNRWFAPVVYGLPISLPPLYLSHPGEDLTWVERSLKAMKMLHFRVAPLVCLYNLSVQYPTSFRKQCLAADRMRLYKIMRAADINEVVLWMADPVQWKWNANTLLNLNDIRAEIEQFGVEYRSAA